MTLLKGKNRFKWIQEINNIKACVEEIIIKQTY